MIFLDTSAIYALASASDPNHAAAERRLNAILSSGEPLLTHNYVIVESLALLQRRLGMHSAIAFAREAQRFAVEWIDGPTHDAAMIRWISRKTNISFVDQVSFVLMDRLAIQDAFAFDDDFKAAGFRIVAG